MERNLKKRKMERVKDSFVWKDYTWASQMENGRRFNLKHPWQWYSDGEVMLCEDDCLSLSLKRKEGEISHYGITYRPAIACGTVMSIDRFGHGVFEAELSLPRGTNLWPSFWLVGDERWPFAGEIDVCEAYSNSNSDGYFKMFTKNFPFINPSWRTTTNVHYSKNRLLNEYMIGEKNVSVFKQFRDPSENFVKYKCVWDKDLIEIYAGNRLVRRDTESAKRIQEYWDFVEKEPKTRVVFNIWCKNPSLCNVYMKTPMMINDFHFEAF